MKKTPPPLPTREQILAFVEEADIAVGKREIAKAFGVRGQDKIELKALLKEMDKEGVLTRGKGRTVHRSGELPKVAVLRVIDISDSGRAIAEPAEWEGADKPPRVMLIEKKRGGAVGIGDRVLARIETHDRGPRGHILKKLERLDASFLAVVIETADGLLLQPVDKRKRHSFMLDAGEDAPAGELVLAEPIGRGRLASRARIVERLGDALAPRSFSLIAIHEKGLPYRFAEAALKDAEAAARMPIGKREDLTHLPILTIDPVDARDHDDAVWAARDADPANREGWVCVVAIADVSFYVRPGTALDRAARERGNSAYFPDRVVPMLPEALSTDACSLKAGKPRPVLACHLQITARGELKSWRFSRAVINVVENIAYEAAQSVIDGESQSSHAAELKALWGAWGALSHARDHREPLDLDLPERRIVLDDAGRIMSVEPRARLDAHRVIEDFMIAANVAAAKALEAKKAPCVYRVHEVPSREKLVALKDYLKSFGINFALGQVIRPEVFNRVLEKLRHHDELQQVSEQVLRTQTQAYYSPRNLAHFGLALDSYAHFTSPIRRYSDLLVHRSLVGAYGLGDGRLAPEDEARLEEISEHISMTERRAADAERDTIDRYVAAYLSERVGMTLPVQVTGVTRAGLFARVQDIGGDGLLPISRLGDERFDLDEARLTLKGRETGTTYKIGQKLQLTLAEANAVTGALRFELPEADELPPVRRRTRRQRRVRRG